MWRIILSLLLLVQVAFADEITYDDQYIAVADVEIYDEVERPQATELARKDCLNMGKQDLNACIEYLLDN